MVTVISSSSSRIDKPLKGEKDDTILEEEFEENAWADDNCDGGGGAMTEEREEEEEALWSTLEHRALLWCKSLIRK